MLVRRDPQGRAFPAPFPSPLLSRIFSVSGEGGYRRSGNRRSGMEITPAWSVGHSSIGAMRHWGRLLTRRGGPQEASLGVYAASNDDHKLRLRLATTCGVKPSAVMLRQAKVRGSQFTVTSRRPAVQAEAQRGRGLRFGLSWASFWFHLASLGINAIYVIARARPDVSGERDHYAWVIQ